MSHASETSPPPGISGATVIESPVSRSFDSDFQELIMNLRDAYRLHQRSIFRPGFHAIAVYWIARWRLKRKSKLVRSLLCAFTEPMFVLLRNFYGIELSEEIEAGRGFHLGHQSGIVIHPKTRFGENCLVRQNVTIGAINGSRWVEAPVFGNNVQIGAGAAIIGRLKIGDNVQIGPNAVVTMNVPSNSTVFGNPARFIEHAPRAADT